MKLITYAEIFPTSLLRHLPLAHIPLTMLRNSDSLCCLLGNVSTCSKEDYKPFFH
jgi:hypothetical protein